MRNPLFGEDPLCCSRKLYARVVVVVAIGFTSISALKGLRQLESSTSDFTRSLERLSSGQRINRASDDAAGLAIASDLRVRSRVYTQAIRNGNDGVSALAIADGALGEGASIITRLQELATSAANGPYSSSQRQSLNREAFSLVAEFNRMLGSTDFNQLKLIDGSLGELSIQLGYGNSGRISFGLGSDMSHKYGDSNFTSGASFGFASGSINSADLLSGDFDGDGIADVVSLDTGGNLQIALSAGGSFSGVGDIPGTFTNVFTSISVGDLNGDGKMDIFGQGILSESIDVLLGDGTGGFVHTTTGAISTQLNPIIAYNSALDLNGDGRLDLAMFNPSTNYVETYLGTGTGGFVSGGGFTCASGQSRMSVGDFNGDGKDDLVFSNGTDLRSYLSSGDGRFSFSSLVNGIAASLFNFQTGDFNGDGYSDVVGFSGNNAVFHYGQGNGNFGSAVQQSFGGSVSKLVAGDFNNDGLTDVAGISSSRIRLLSNQGQGNFALSTSVIGSLTVYCAGDFNGDGVLDIAGGRTSSGSTVIYTQGSAQTTNMRYIDLSSKEDARSALDYLSTLSSSLAKQRGSIGATQSRLESAMRNLYSARDNFTSAEGRIRDADIAAESALSVAASIRQQVAAQVLAQASAAPRLALELLR